MSRHRYLSATVIATVARWLVILASSSSAQAQTAAPFPSASATDGNELQQVTVTGYLIPRVGDGPQPVTSYGQDYIDKTGSQTIADVLQNLPGAVNNWSPSYTSGFGFSPGSASVALKGLPCCQVLRYALKRLPSRRAHPDSRLRFLNSSNS